MGVEFTQHIAHGTGGFLVLGLRREPQLGHGIDDSTLDGFEPVANVGQSPIQNDVHRVIEIRLLGKCTKRQRLRRLAMIRGHVGHDSCLIRLDACDTRVASQLGKNSAPWFKKSTQGLSQRRVSAGAHRPGYPFPAARLCDQGRVSWPAACPGYPQCRHQVSR